MIYWIITYVSLCLDKWLFLFALEAEAGDLGRGEPLAVSYVLPCRSKAPSPSDDARLPEGACGGSPREALRGPHTELDVHGCTEVLGGSSLST